MFVHRNIFRIDGSLDVGVTFGRQEMRTRDIFIKLFELHRAGIICGDTRIQNIFLLEDGSPRWNDLRSPPGTLTDDVMSCGTTTFGTSVADDCEVKKLIADYLADISSARIAAIYEVCKTKGF
jgi:hypothetical protein